MKPKIIDRLLLATSSSLSKDGFVKIAFVEIGGDFDAVIQYEVFRKGDLMLWEERAIEAWREIEKFSIGHEECWFVEYSYSQKIVDVFNYYSQIGEKLFGNKTPPRFYPAYLKRCLTHLSKTERLFKNASFGGGIEAVYEDLTGTKLIINDCYSEARAIAVICDEIQNIYSKEYNNGMPWGHFIGNFPDIT